jgi:chaperone-like protein
MIAYEGLRKVAAKKPLHAASVSVTAWGLRVAREAEEGAARARVAVADVVAEAAERIGDDLPPPATPSVDDPSETDDAVR